MREKEIKREQKMKRQMTKKRTENLRTHNLALKGKK